MDNKYHIEPVIIDNHNLEPPVYDEGTDAGIYENRSRAYYDGDPPGVPKCSIIVIGYNELEKTRYCVECVLKYTSDIDYELVLLDNGSDDGTYGFFQSVPYKKKVVIRIEKNIGVSYGITRALKVCKGKYIVTIPNDVYLTKGALSNLLFCLESDPSIGIAIPMSPHVGNRQDLSFDFSTMDEMQEKAAAFNQCNPDKWEERMMLVSVLWIYRREIIDIVGIGDSAYIHEASESDYCTRIRRAGYTLLLCADTWVYHDHSEQECVKTDTAEQQAISAHGAATYSMKYHGLDAYEDFCNYSSELLSPLDSVPVNENPSILCLDVRAGTPVLEVRNKLSKRGIDTAASYAITTKAKYFIDLQTVCNDVICDRIEYIYDYCDDNSFDIIVCGEPVNLYNKPFELLVKLYKLLTLNGVLLFSVRNVDDFRAFLRSSRSGAFFDSDMPAAMTSYAVVAHLLSLGGKDAEVNFEAHAITPADREKIFTMVKQLKGSISEEDKINLMVKNYTMKVIKG